MAGLDARHTGLVHLIPGRCQGPLHVDRAARILDHHAVEFEPARVERSPRHAEIGREPADEHALDTELFEIALQAGAALAIGFEEGPVAVHRPAPTLADDAPPLRHCDVLVKRSSLAA